MTGSTRANEQHPLLAAARPFDMVTTSSSSSTTTVVSYTSFRAAGGRSSPAAVAPSLHVFAQQHRQQQLSRKYVALPVEDVVGQKRARSRPVPLPTPAAPGTTGYGTMALAIDVGDSDGEDADARNNNRQHRHSQQPHSQFYYSQTPAKKRAAGSAAALRSLLCKLDDPRRRAEADHPSDASCSNQSETESDSDGSCGSNTNSSSSSAGSLQSILRIREGIYACRKVKKQVSVEFRLDASDREVEDVERRKLGALSCASSCMPRRLTIEEKAALYRVRPDLQLTPLPLLMRELDEIRRRRQRRLMFSALGGTLILLMMLVFYYLLTETP